MRKTPTYPCEIICTQCGNISTIQRSTSKKKEMCATKSAWCYHCKKETINFVIIDKVLAYNYLMERKELDEREQFVLNLLKNKSNIETNKVLKKEMK